MDLGYLSIRAFGSDALVGDAGAGGIGTVSGLVCIWVVVGFGADDESGAWGTPSIFVGLGGMGASGNGTRFGGPANWDEFTEWQWVTVRDDPRSYPYPY